MHSRSRMNSVILSVSHVSPIGYRAQKRSLGLNQPSVKELFCQNSFYRLFSQKNSIIDV